MTETHKLADKLLEEWWRWSRTYRLNLGYPRISAGLHYPENRRWDSENDVTDTVIRKTEMEAVDWCVNELPVSMQQVIGVTMRNMDSKAAVWRFDGTVNYSDALDSVIPLMKRKGLIDNAH